MAFEFVPLAWRRGFVASTGCTLGILPHMAAAMVLQRATTLAWPSCPPRGERTNAWVQHDELAAGDFESKRRRLDLFTSPVRSSQQCQPSWWIWALPALLRAGSGHANVAIRLFG